ncbi:MAG: aspartate-semialdehyde dehydrogenase [Candidatus Coatesbacteria bacterium]|nr:aspartate-semialdehyde dehydrogenase [Candidatus Coatesbacteria bacterium]
MSCLNIAIVGATGAVGQELIKILEERKFPVNNLSLFASEKSEGRNFKFKGSEISVRKLDYFDFKKTDLVFFAAKPFLSKTFLPEIIRANITTIDKSSTYRMEKNVPLVVPGVNEESIGNATHIATPNCTTIQLVLVLQPIIKWGVESLEIFSYQAVSGTGMSALNEYLNQCRQFVDNKEVTNEVYPYRIFDNILPHIGRFDEQGFSDEERKLENETKKIFDLQEIKIFATCIRVPVSRGHSIVVSLKTTKPASINDIISEWKKSIYLEVADDPESNIYPMPMNVACKDLVQVGRLRQTFNSNSFQFLCCGDNLRVGAALNAVRIAEYLLKIRF